MKVSDFDYALPKELIAQEPLPRRDASRLLVLERRTGRVEHRRFPEVVDLLRGETLWLNDTKVFPARVPLLRETGGRIEALLVRRLEPRRWLSLLDAGGKLKIGEKLKVEDRRYVRLVAKEDYHWTLEFDEEPDLPRLGQVPLPPYIRRTPDAGDVERYQTVFARAEGSIAAPTAGLHFTPEILSRFDVRRLTLHVGVGTFKPVKVEDTADHRMHEEWYEIPEPPTSPVVAVGTTTTRALETWARTGRTSGWTDIFITPPYAFRAVKALVTNFHLPKSTLLMLVSAFAGREAVLAAYAEAVRARYRFFSYGDAMLIL
jgi:S-adenosylmethionine:tRNA ribosyltransferase-isomerase